MTKKRYPLSSIDNFRFLFFYICVFCAAFSLNEFGTQAATITLSTGGDLQAALNQAQPGDTIILQAGAVFIGEFTLPYKNGNSYITIRTSTPDSNLPVGIRVTPNDAAKMPKIVSPGFGGSALRTATAAHHYRLIGLEVLPIAPQAVVYDLIAFGTDGPDQDNYSEVPHDLSIDRCFIHGWPNANFKRGVALNSAETEVINSYISDIHSDEQDSQAISGYNGPGPFHIINNRLEGAGENILFGGATASIYGLIPSNIEIRRNNIYKSLSWRQGQPGSTNYIPVVKNLFELKNAKNVVVEGNIFENNWAAAQSGIGILFTVRGEAGTMPWATVEDITFVNNIIRNSEGGVSILAHDDLSPSGTARRISVRNNLFDNIGGLFLQMSGGESFGFSHNTILQTNNLISLYGDQSGAFTFKDNIARNNDYGIIGDGRAPGNDSINTFLPGSVFTRNILEGANSIVYPVGNYFPASDAQIGFTNPAAGNYRLAASSPYKNAGSDGTDVGADINAIEAAYGGTTGNTNTPPSAALTSPANNASFTAPADITLTAAASDTDGTVTNVEFYNGSTKIGENSTAPYNFTWTNVPVGTYALTAKAFDNSGASSVSGSVSVIVNAPSPSTQIPNGTYKITAKHSGKSLEVSGASRSNGAVIDQWDYFGGHNQKWVVEALGDGTYKLTALNSGKVLDVYGAATNNGAFITQWDYNGGDNQRWRIELVGDGYYRVISKNSGKALDVAGISYDNGAPVHQWTYFGFDNQLWRFDSLR